MPQLLSVKSGLKSPVEKIDSSLRVNIAEKRLNGFGVNLKPMKGNKNYANDNVSNS
jgi:hypothetical protein